MNYKLVEVIDFILSLTVPILLFYCVFNEMFPEKSDRTCYGLAFCTVLGIYFSVKIVNDDTRSDTK